MVQQQHPGVCGTQVPSLVRDMTGRKYKATMQTVEDVRREEEDLLLDEEENQCGKYE